MDAQRAVGDFIDFGFYSIINSKFSIFFQFFLGKLIRLLINIDEYNMFFCKFIYFYCIL